MLLTEMLTDKRGPLAKIWMSAHQEKKLSKRDALGIDIEESVEAILTHDEGPVTLRLSGQLMLGVTRIYSRKAQSLFEDCRYTRENITKAFRPGVVDLPEDQQRTNNNAITLADTRNDFDFFDWSWSSAMPPPPINRETSGPSRQYLRAQTREYGAYNFGRMAPGSIYGGSTPSRQSQDGDDTSKLDSQDFRPIDLELGLDNAEVIPDNVSDLLPITGRRQSTAGRRSMSGLRDSRDKSIDPNFGMEDFPEMPELDLNLDIDIGALPGLDGEVRSRRESSALSTPPPLSPPETNEITPRTAAKIAGLPEPRDKSSPTAAPKAKKARLVQADHELELDESEFAMNRDNSDILGEERYISADPRMIRLRQIMEDPTGHFLPNVKNGGDNMFYAGPQDLAPELAELFTFPSNILRKRPEDGEQDDRQAKRARTEAEDEIEDPEVGRRMTLAPSERGQSGFPGDDFVLPIPDIEPPHNDFEPDTIFTPGPQDRMRTPSVAPSIAPSNAEIFNQRSTGDHMLAMFEKPEKEQGESQSQTTPQKSVVSEPISRTSSGYSKNTGMAMGLLQRELEAIEEEDKVIGLEKIAEKASKRAASAFFFELLVLGTQDAIKLAQPQAFGDVEIRAKEKLFEEIRA